MTRVGLAAGVLMLLAACGADGADPGDSTAAGADAGVPASTGSMPPIYIDQQIEILDDGRNQLRRNYEFALQGCQEAGKLTRALTEEELAKVGTMRLQRWIKSDRAAYRREEFNYTSGSLQSGQLCEFNLTRGGVHVYLDADQTTTLELDTGETSRSTAPAAHILDRGVASTEEANPDSTTTPEPDAILGEPCVRREGADGVGSSCVWSGGSEWGFGVPPGPLLVDNVDHLLHAIVLQQEPGPRGQHRVTTKQFIVGADFDDEAMQPAAESPAAGSGPGR
ncbi:hypothetical protein [Lysobacter sp. F6437]|uniref:hypothetical protein n=1 Tax=Lysobacter sp. F6437 TaxID=3459296 RepID=UPI00403E32BA